MTQALDIYRQATRLGLRLEPRGDKLVVIPASRCTPELLNEIREHKAELLAMAKDRRESRLPDDCLPWINIARQIMDGEFHGSDGTTIESLTIGVRSIDHPLCKRAMEMLDTMRNQRRRR